MSSLFGFAGAQDRTRTVPVPAKVSLDELIRNEDTDNDRRITIEDSHIAGSDRGDKRFWLNALDGRRYEVAGTYYLSNLLQELKLAEEAGRDTALLELQRVFEAPADRISRMIRDQFWNGLTRQVDVRGLDRILADDKTSTVDGKRYVYVPSSDARAFGYFSDYAHKHPELNMMVVWLPKRMSGEFVQKLNGYHGLLTLGLQKSDSGELEGVPFVVPGGRFNEMYGWDSYFISLGLLHDGRVALARAMVDNFVYEVTNYGKILNANRTYYLTRSQPPFFTSMLRAVYSHLPRTDSTKLWLHAGLDAAIDEYTNVWMNKDHLTKIGLSRYFDTGRGPPPEVEQGHFDAIYAPFAKKVGLDVRSFERDYVAGTIAVPELDTFFVHDRAMRESGHDTSYRLLGVCADLTTVDLNSLLYRIERDIGDLIRQEFRNSFRSKQGKTYTSAEWYTRADSRRARMTKFLWNADRGMFFDFDVRQGRQHTYVSPTTFYPLWAGLATNEQAGALVTHALPLLEAAGGIVGSDEQSRGEISPDRPERQWDYPNGWAPHQMLVWQGLLNYGYDAVVHRLVYRWLYTITANAADYNGTIPEKYDLVRRSHQVFAEYGNVGTKFSYITREGFGWTNASYQIGLSLLPQQFRDELNRLIPPEWIFAGD